MDVAIETECAPNVALEAILRLAVALVALVTVIFPGVPWAAPPTEIPGPKFAVVKPLIKFV